MVVKHSLLKSCLGNLKFRLYLWIWLSVFSLRPIKGWRSWLGMPVDTQWETCKTSEASVPQAYTACRASPGRSASCSQTVRISLSLSRFQRILWIRVMRHLSNASLELKKTFHLLVFLWSANFLLSGGKKRKEKKAITCCLAQFVLHYRPPPVLLWLAPRFLFSGICAQASSFCVVLIIPGFFRTRFCKASFHKDQLLQYY